MKRLIVVLFALSVMLAPRVQAQDDANRAAIVVDTSEMCVFFGEPEITGLELLQRSNLDVVTEVNANGAAVCKIDGTGCDRGDCFCDYPSFWGYWTRDTSAWTFSEVGASERKVTDGSVDGWSYGKDGKPEPPDRSFDDVCGQAVALPTDRGLIGESTTDRPRYLLALPFIVVLGGAIYFLRRRRTRP
jgi:hypothetical protein